MESIRQLVQNNASDEQIIAAIRQLGYRDSSRSLVQQQAPRFRSVAVVDEQFKQISLDDYLNAGKWVVLFFYPLDFTFVCPTEIIAFSDRLAEFEAINTQPIACSCDSEFSHLAWVKMPRNSGGLGQMKIPIVADFTKDIASRYGVLVDGGVSLRGLFIIDPRGVVRQVTLNDLPVGRNVDETLRLVQAFQFTDEHGEVCPANWRPGAKTMVADTNKSKKYFAAVAETGSVTCVSEQAELEQVLRTDKLVVIDFFAPWCMNCKKVTPLVERLAAEFSDRATFVKVDTDASTEIADQYEVSVLPTVVFIRNGAVVLKYTGSDNSKIEEALRSLF